MLMTLPIGTADVYASDNTYMTTRYDVDVVVSEDNSYDYHETLDIYYATPHHGIYRYIPINGSKISKIRVPGYEYETYTQSGNTVLKIGSGSYTITGPATYDITYNLAMYEDENPEMDMLLLNLIPTGWETDIDSSVCTVQLPKEADLSKVQIYSGSYGTDSNEDNIQVETGSDGKTIILTGSNIPSNHGVTLMLELPQGYWVGAPEFGKVSPNMILLFLLGPAGAFLLWYFYGRDERMTKTVEFYPPDGLTPGEIGYLMDGRVDRQDIISNIVYLADKGYMAIEQIDRKEFIFYNLKEPGSDEPQYIRTLWTGLFSGGVDHVSSRKLGVYFGRKYETAVEQLAGMFSGSRSINKSESHLARFGCYMAALMPSVAFSVWASASGSEDAGFGCIWAAFHIIVATWFMCSVYDRLRSTSKVKTVLKSLAAIWFFYSGIGVLIMCADSMEYLTDTKKILVVSLLILGTLVSMFFAVIAVAKKEAYTRLLGRILGFRDFIRTAELDKLEDDPEYFYHIIPYAYVFGLTDKWIKNFEDIPIITPRWVSTRYGTFDRFDYYMMGRMMSDCSASVRDNIVIPSSDGGGFSGGGGSHGGGSSWSGGGGFSGGGFSGGGAGGGGGGAW